MTASALPPFAAMRVIEAVVRHKNFSRAARELNISHAAVSQAIKRFETQNNVHLFDRSGSAIVPSEGAMELAASYAHAAQDIMRSLEAVLPKSED